MGCFFFLWGLRWYSRCYSAVEKLQRAVVVRSESYANTLHNSSWLMRVCASEPAEKERERERDRSFSVYVVQFSGR